MAALGGLSHDPLHTVVTASASLAYLSQAGYDDSMKTECGMGAAAP